MTDLRTPFRVLLGAALLALSTTPLLAAGSHDGDHGANVGHPGMAADVGRTVDVMMTDNAFSIPDLDVKPGETIRFVLHNRGHFLHEFAINTPQEHHEHEAEMAEMFASGALSMMGTGATDNHMGGNYMGGNYMGGGHMGGNHMGLAAGPATEATEPHTGAGAILVNPGDSAEMIWTFPKSDPASQIEFACTVPGHYASGMVGPVHIDQ
ncbi:MAG: hypothetical protein H5U19_01665 [Rhodobacteraceae bacterium]|jgi:uncharacterized cupredoxin-like copper-binding protein|nr:hypothetical protein [Paracoccaceae bacterium]